MGLSAFPALSGAGGCADGVCVGWLAARSFGVRRFTDDLQGGVSSLPFDGRRNGALYGLLYLISKRSLGLADVFLAAASSLWLLPMYGLLSLWLTSLAALLWCAFLLLRGRLGRRTEIRFVPFLAIGGALAYGVQETVGMASLLASLGLSSL